MLTRREFLKGMGAGVLLGSGIAYAPTIIQSLRGSLEGKISFEQARDNIGLRQRYLEQILCEILGEFSNINSSNIELIYDHDKSQAKNESIKSTNEYYGHPRYWKYLMDYYMKDDFFAQYDNDREARIREYLSSKEFVKQLEEQKATVIKKSLDVLDSAEGAAVIHQPYTFGIAKKFKNYFFDVAFREGSYLSGEEKVVLPSSEEWIKTGFVHELQHIDDYSSGIKLEEGLEMNNLNYYDINNHVSTFIIESRAYIKQMHFNRRTFGQDHVSYFHVSYLRSFFRFNKFLKENAQNFPKELTDYDLKLFNHQYEIVKHEIKNAFSFENR